MRPYKIVGLLSLAALAVTSLAITITRQEDLERQVVLASIVLTAVIVGAAVHQGDD